MSQLIQLGNGLFAGAGEGSPQYTTVYEAHAPLVKPANVGTHLDGEKQKGNKVPRWKNLPFFLISALA